MSRHVISSLAAALAIIATSALAQNPAGGDAFKKYGTDGDGRITRAEAGDAPWFDKVDRNEDGMLDAGELNVLRDAMEMRGAGR